MKWFRFYSEVMHDPKVLCLSDSEFRMWVNLLCLANEGEPRGVLPAPKEIAAVFRMKEAKVKSLLASLVVAKLVDCDAGGGMSPHNWEARQFGADSSSHRVQKYRDKMRANGDTLTGYTKHRAAVLERDGNACVYCGSTAKLVLDHLVPVNRGGDGEPDNLVAACKSCNSGKAGRLFEETGYRLANESTVTQYEDVKSRLGLTVTVNPVTPVTVTGARHVTPVTPRVRADSDSDSDSDSETDSDSDSETDGGTPTPPVERTKPKPSPNTPAETDDAVERVAEMFGGLDGIPQTARSLCRDVKAAWVVEAAESMHGSGKADPQYFRKIIARYRAQGGSDAERTPARASPPPRPSYKPPRLTPEQLAALPKG